MDALDLLHEDHRAILEMLEQLESGPADGRAVTPADLPARRQLVTDLVIAESAHEAVEEKHFWPHVRRWLADGEDLLAPALRQEQDAKKVLAELDRLPAGEPRFEQLIARVTADARDHIAYEEQEVWPLVRARVGTRELKKLGRTMAKAARTAPTRPHPHTPPSPGALRTVGAAAAVVDKARDAVRGRTTSRAPWAGQARRSGTPTGRSRFSEVVTAVITVVLVIAVVRPGRRRARRRSMSHGGADGPGGPA